MSVMVIFTSQPQLLQPTNIVGDGEKIFVKYHIFTLEGTVPRNLKKILDLIWNRKCDDFYTLRRPIEDKFHLHYMGRSITLYQDVIFFMNKETGAEVILKASFRVQGIHGPHAGPVSLVTGGGDTGDHD